MPVSKSVMCSVMVVCFLSTLSMISQAQTFEFQEGENGYSGTSDMTFLIGDASALTGDDPEWEWDGSDAGAYNVGVLHFADIIGDGADQIPPNSTVVEAMLTLTCTNEGNAEEIATVHNLLKPFDESLDFIDFTLNFDPIAGDDFEEEVIAEIPGPSAGDIFDVDVTSSLQTWINGGDNYGWMFIPDPNGTNGVGIQSSEAEPRVKPTLIVETPAGTFTFVDGVNGYSGTADTFLNTGDNLSEPQGTDDVFEWDDSDAGGINYGLLRFDDIIGDGEGQIPPGTEITSAVIQLSIVDPGATASLHEILEGNEGEPTFFDDENTSLLEFGDMFGPRPGIDYAEEPVATDIIADVGKIEIDVTSSIEKYSGGEENRGWIFIPVTSGGVEVVSSEGLAGGGPPKLTVVIQDGNTRVYEFLLHK